MRAFSIATVVVVAVLAGCGGSGAKKNAQRTVVHVGPTVPWTAQQPDLVAARAAVRTFCRGADLAVHGQVTFVPRLQGGVALVQLWNRSTHSCRLTGRPRVRLVKNGGPAQVERAIPTTAANFPEVPYPPSTLLALRPGEPAALTITWDNWCDRQIPGKPRLPPSALRVTLPAGRGTVDADYNAVPTCLDPSQPSTIGVSKFQPSLARSGRPWTSAVLTASVADRTLIGRRGGVLRFVVVLKNISSSTAVFTRCPAYVQQLVPSGGVELYDLNCAGAHPLAPGKREAFAMRIRIPDTSPLGANGLFWELDPLGRRGPQIHVRVHVRR